MKISAKRGSYSKTIKTVVAAASFLGSLGGNATLPAFAVQKKIASATTATSQTTLFGHITGSGTLNAIVNGKSKGQCPLKDTKVTAKISGYVSRVSVKQTFANPFKEKIEAVYTFPLSSTAAIDSMVMKIGDRTIKGSIKKREEARKLYEAARRRGQVASLLDQERPNIFTQAVANIEPGKEVEITIDYIDLLPFEKGDYSFTFPTVVGPRFMPGKPISSTGTGRSPDTDQVPDASKISPPVTPKGTRAGHDISIEVELDATVPIKNLSSKLHQVDIVRNGTNKATIKLTNKKAIPNRDFVLNWQVSGDDVKSGYMTYRNPKKDSSGYFTLMLLPPKKVETKSVAPKEMIFLIDCSGSQHGKPLAKAKETLNYIVDHMNPQDTFQIVSFNSRVQKLFTQPRSSTPQMRAKAKAYIQSLQARGGTWMEPAVKEVCSTRAPENRLRIVSFMTDGYVGNDMQIIGLVKKLRDKSRWFPFGTGNSVNRFLINGIAREGGGESEFVLLNSKPGVVGKKFYDRISTPILTDVKVSFSSGLEVKEVFPKNVSDVWARKPLYIKGRYLKAGKGTVTLTGFQKGKPYKQTLSLNFPENNTTNSGIASVWARAKVDRLMSEGWIDAQRGKLNKELKDEIVACALKHHIMTQYTSFVAVDSQSKTKGGEPKQVTVPVEMPDGVSREGIFGKGFGQMQPGAGGPVAYRRSGALTLGMPSATHGAYLASPAPRSRASYSINRAYLGKAKFYKAPRQYQIVANKPIIAKKHLVKIDEEREVKDDKRVEKISSELKSFSQGKSTSGLTMENGKVKVEITLSKFNLDIQKQLKELKVDKLKTIYVSNGVYKVTGFVAKEDIEKLAELSFVKHIKAAR